MKAEKRGDFGKIFFPRIWGGGDCECLCKLKMHLKYTKIRNEKLSEKAGRARETERRA